MDGGQVLGHAAVKLHKEEALVMLVSKVLADKGGKVYTIHPDKAVKEVAKELRERNIGAAVVTDLWGKVRGVISERDIVFGIGKHGDAALDLQVEELMTNPARVCEKSDDLAHIMALMTHRRVRHVVVLEGDELAGIVSIGDVLKNQLDETELEVRVLRDYARASLP